MKPELPSWELIELPDHGPLPVHDIPGPPGAPTLLLVHGWTVTSDLNWFACYRQLARRYRVVAFDQRGHGGGIRTRQRFRFEDCASDAIAVADQLGIDRFVAVGYSMGGAIAQTLARDHPERLDGVVLCATAAHFAVTSAERARMSLLPIIGLASRIVPRGLRSSLFEWALDRSTRNRRLSSWAMAELASCDPQGILDAGTALLLFDSRPWIGQTTVPTSVVVTTDDEVVPVERQWALQARVPGATVHEVQGRHSVVAYKPERFLPALHAAASAVLCGAARPPATAAVTAEAASATAQP